MKEMIEQSNEILDLHFNFKHKLQVSKIKIEHGRMFEDYNREESRAELAISRFGEAPKEGLEDSLKVKPMNIVFIRRKLKEAFEGAVDATMESRFIVKDYLISLQSLITPVLTSYPLENTAATFCCDLELQNVNNEIIWEN